MTSNAAILHKVVTDLTAKFKTGRYPVRHLVSKTTFDKLVAELEEENFKLYGTRCALVEVKIMGIPVVPLEVVKRENQIE